MDIKKASYEQLAARLEEIVSALSSGDLTLDETIKLFEEGMKVAAAARKHLENCLGKIEEIDAKYGEEENDG